MADQPSLSADAAANRIRAFFEADPLLKPLQIELSEPVAHLSGFMPDRLQMPCRDGGCAQHDSTTWTRFQESYSPLYAYKCSLCSRSEVRFWIITQVVAKETQPVPPNTLTSKLGGTSKEVIKTFRLTKAGQWPPWAPKISNRLEKNLGPRAALFRRAVACIQEGLGIGACAYLRRVIEEETNDILDLIERAARAEGDGSALENLKEARLGTTASKRLEIAATKVPIALRPGGTNPLARLYGVFSEGVHQLSDAEAVVLAQDLMKAFIFVFEQLREQIEQADEYARSITANRESIFRANEREGVARRGYAS